MDETDRSIHIQASVWVGRKNLLDEGIERVERCVVF